MLDWQPFELRPGMPEEGMTLPAHIRARLDDPRHPLKARARALGLTLAERDRVPSPRRAHECTEHARRLDRLQPFHAALLRAYWTEGKDIHDWPVLAEAAAQAGLDAGEMRRAVESGAHRAAVDERIAEAHALGIHAVPTFLIDERGVVEGAQTIDAFRQALQRLGIDPRRRS